MGEPSELKFKEGMRLSFGTFEISKAWNGYFLWRKKKINIYIKWIGFVRMNVLVL